MALIKKAGEIPTRNNLRMCIYAPAGVGKTTLACSAPRPLLIDVDGSAYRLHQAHQVDTVEVSSYNDIEELLERYDISEYKTIIFDTFGKLLECIGVSIIRDNQKYDAGSGTLTKDGYGIVAQKFRELCRNEILAEKNILFLAHQDNASRGDKPYYEPMGTGKNFARLATELDLIGHIEMYGDNRILTFNPSEMYAGKNTCNLPAKLEIPVLIDSDGNIIEQNVFLSEQVIAPYFKRQQVLKEQADKYATIVDKYKRAIKAANTLAEFNELYKRSREEQSLGSISVALGVLFGNASTERGYEYNKEKEIYYEPAKATKRKK